MSKRKTPQKPAQRPARAPVGTVIGVPPMGPPSMSTRYKSLDWVMGGGNIAPSPKPKEEELPKAVDEPTRFFNSRAFVGTLPAKGKTPEFSGWLSRFIRRK